MKYLRDINVDGYSLTIWDTGRRNQGKHVLGYELKDGNTTTIFNAEDFDVASLPVTDDMVRTLLHYLTLQESEAAASYFAKYTSRQRRFRDKEAPDLLVCWRARTKSTQARCDFGRLRERGDWERRPRKEDSRIDPLGPERHLLERKQ